MGTPHNEAQTGDIAKTVLMPGDPLRAKYIADNYLTDVSCFNTVRNMSGFTGIYNGCRVSVMGSGMGMPSMGIYSYELYNVYDVDNIIRIYAPIADFTLLKTAYDVAEEKHFSVKVGNVLASDVFYNDDTTVNDRWKKMGVLAVDMESAALYMTAARCRKHALTILTISDHLYRGEKLSAQERQTGFTNMMETALETAVRLQNNRQMEDL